ncbi:MAG: polyribonucleotide nucleotidyltransferase, partial [Chloroflexi bacterium]|nr:polyribonucleotide nucleotidyltransferase [Chloroflexota bacterium]
MSNLYQTTLGEHPISLETGKLAGQAGGAVTVRSGDTVLLATATAAKEPREGLTFFPLTVDYEERLYAAGKIPGGFFKREGRPSEQAILLCRLTDRALRPLFPKNLRHEVQVILTALSADQENYLDILALIGASAAVSISDIPFKGPMSAVRMGLIDGRLVINPTASQMASSILDLRLAGTRETVLMIEAEGKEIGEAQIWEAVRLGHQAMQNVIDVQERMMAEVGKPKREALTYFQLPAEVRRVIEQRAGGLPTQILTAAMGKEERNRALDNLHTQLLTELPSLGELFTSEAIEAAWEELLRQEFRALVLSRGLRPDGRRPEEIRPLSCEAGMLPRTHGSGLFTRGETQVLTIATLGTASDEQILDGLTPLESKRFMHHYNFPPYSTGETRPLRGPGRREIGHGALAERALAQVIPSEEAFPYTLRLVSEVLSSNGSTSMASVCGSSLALMDAGVPLAAHVAGISMGLVKGDEGFTLLTDIQGVEDALGDMDFKVAGTR